MTASVVALLAFAGTLAAALLGLRLRDTLPEHHLESEARDAVKLIMGLVATMSALVLGLLISVTQSAYRTQAEELSLLASNLVTLDRVLLHYGPEAAPVRLLLRDGVETEVARVVSDGVIRPDALLPTLRDNPLEPFHKALQRLQPATDAQRLGLARAIELAVAISRTRMMLVQQEVSALPAPFLGMLVFWLSVLFLGFGLLTPLNATVLSALLIGALSVAGALFLILELDRPFDGLMRLSDAPLRAAQRALE